MATDRKVQTVSPSWRGGGRRDPGSHPAPHAPIRLAAPTYILQTQPGLEAVAFAEVAERFAGSAAKRSALDDVGVERTPSRRLPNAGVHELARRVVPTRAGMSLFYAPRVEPLRGLRASEDIFAVVGYASALTHDRRALERIRMLARDTSHVDEAIATRVKMLRGARAGRRLTFRVIARMVGAQEFRRAEFKRAIERGIDERGDHAWRLVEDESDVEFWATLLDDELVLAIRLTDETMRQRDYKVAHIPGSLRPSVAAALGLLSQPTPSDIVLDPFCGAGTVLIERAHLARYQALIGSDIDDQALTAARTNIGPRYKPIELHSWDAVAIPLPDHSVNRIVTNLPWGVQHGSHAENRRLYPRVFSEFARLIQPNGLIVMLTGETRLMGDLLHKGALQAERILRVSILGTPAAIYVCRVA